MAALANVFATRFSSLPPSLSRRVQDDAERASIISDDASVSPASSSLSSSLDTRGSCHVPPSQLVPRPNEHLAVLLSKRLWKPDSQAAQCDVFLCRKRFSVFERRHHCRKCGGIFCADCSSRSTTLLDASSLEFLHPPRNVPIAVYDSPTSPVVDARVCDDCWDQIHGYKSMRSPVLKHSSPISMTTNEEDSHSSSSSLSSSVSTPPDLSPISALARPAIRRTHTSPRIPQSSLRPISPRPQSLSGSALVADSELSLGELDSYPLKRASVICKATGGGRWEPKPVTIPICHRIPGCKAPYELELEAEEAEIRRRRANPVIKHGDFQLRAPREVEPRSPAGPITLSTF